MEKIVLKSGQVYEGNFRAIVITREHFSAEFQKSFAVRCYSKYVPVKFTRKSVKSSTLPRVRAFKWNSECPICGFKAKNNRGLAIHKAKCHEIENVPKKSEVVEIQDFKIQAPKKLSLRKIAKTLETTKKIENVSIREVYRMRMKNQLLRESESYV